MTDLVELAKRVEALTGPCRGTDHAIAVAIGRPANWVGFQLDRYTASLDAAMILVPEGWHTRSFRQGPSGGNWWELASIRDGDQFFTSVQGKGKTPALALVSVALQARAKVEGGTC